MSEASDAAEQVVRMMLSGSEVAVRLGGSALKTVLRFCWRWQRIIKKYSER